MQTCLSKVSQFIIAGKEGKGKSKPIVPKQKQKDTTGQSLQIKKEGEMMHLLLRRFASNSHETLGALFRLDDALVSSKEKYMCMILEDEERTVKVWGETRIPAGHYEIILRLEGTHHERYKQKFPDMHKGMLCLVNAPDWTIHQDGMTFKYILIHIGNDEDDTAGCLLTGSWFTDEYLGIDGRFNLVKSTKAYMKIYPVIVEELMKGKKVFITIMDD